MKELFNRGRKKLLLTYTIYKNEFWGSIICEHLYTVCSVFACHHCSLESY